jgi:hypothetical protein
MLPILSASQQGPWAAIDSRGRRVSRKWPARLYAFAAALEAATALRSPVPSRTRVLPRAVIVAALLASTGACAAPPARPNPVGLAFAAYEDGARRSWSGTDSRPMATAIWYPAPIGTQETEWRVSIFKAGWSAQGAPLASSRRKFPLVVLSHGTGGGAATLAWLAETLASNGYIVAAVNHHGNTAAEPSTASRRRSAIHTSHSVTPESRRHSRSPRCWVRR